MQFTIETMVFNDQERNFKDKTGKAMTWREVLLDDPTGEPISMPADGNLPKMEKYMVAKCKIELTKREGRVKLRLIGVEDIRKTVLKAV